MPKPAPALLVRLAMTFSFEGDLACELLPPLLLLPLLGTTYEPGGETCLPSRGEVGGDVAPCARHEAIAAIHASCSCFVFTDKIHSRSLRFMVTTKLIVGDG